MHTLFFKSVVLSLFIVTLFSCQQTQSISTDTADPFANFDEKVAAIEAPIHPFVSSAGKMD
jgi:hypothetical protein